MQKQSKKNGDLNRAWWWVQGWRRDRQGSGGGRSWIGSNPSAAVAPHGQRQGQTKTQLQRHGRKKEAEKPGEPEFRMLEM